ncbi:Spy/CpxP family protein refolding chaperone [Halanaerobacter jeridensis]|uniref:Spy/CpxP family protein refolding chaperone n=1 Tax=Halanaerobacter jeridensis TaxID=706427 RepID=A0A938XQH9_9FIRM|nr:Spy/CpxP family protein refolding chaperone [Halanaerobacter jeridensis]MBM7557562.1 Spy/CpxP family protein refolding chaperone [Halanaerobacter jeridensis]
MKKIVSLVLVLSLVIGVSALAVAYSGQGPKAGGQQGYRTQGRNNQFQQNRMTWQERLNLSEEQVEKMEELRDEYFDQQYDLRDDREDKREELREMYFDSTANKDEIMNLQQEVNQLRTQLADLRMEHRLEMRNILTTEQLEECEDLGSFGRRGRRGVGRTGKRGPRANRGHHRGGFGPGMRY